MQLASAWASSLAVRYRSFGWNCVTRSITLFSEEEIVEIPSMANRYPCPCPLKKRRGFCPVSKNRRLGPIAYRSDWVTGRPRFCSGALYPSAPMRVLEGIPTALTAPKSSTTTRSLNVCTRRFPGLISPDPAHVPAPSPGISYLPQQRSRKTWGSLDDLTS
jgi:hypothetical protein